MAVVPLLPVSWNRMEEGIAIVRHRLRRAAAALSAAAVPYAVVGGNAVAAWVSRVDAAAVRNTRDVVLLLRRTDFERARNALEAAGFRYRQVSSLGRAGVMDVFLDGESTKVRDALHILWAGERPVPEAVSENPTLDTTEEGDGFDLIPLADLVRMKLASNRDKDRMHLRDLAGVGLIDATWLTKLPNELGERLKSILDDPEG